MSDTRFVRGTQVAYLPGIAGEDINHESVEYGFVTSVNGNTVFCRFWHKRDPDRLRTTANSEPVTAAELRVCNTRSQEEVEKILSNL